MPSRTTIILGALLTGLVAMGPISTDMYLPALPILAREFAAPPADVQLTLSLFLAGFAVAQLIYGPLSDRFGRRWVLFGGVILYIGASIACTYAETIEALIAARILQAVGACAGPVLSRAIIRDIYGRERAAKVLAYMGTAMGLIPAAAPILGGYLTVAFGWRSNFVFLVGFAVLLALGVVFILKETNRHRYKEATDPKRLLANYARLAKSRVYAGYVLAAAGAYGGLFAFIQGSAFVLIDVLGVATEDFGPYFASIVIGYMIGTTAAGRLTPRVGLDPMILIGGIITMCSGALMAGLAWAGVATVGAVVLPQILYMVGLGIILPNALAGAIAPFPKMAGAASALLGFTQMSLAAFSGIAVGWFHEASARPMATAVLVLGTLALVAYWALTWPKRGSSH